MGDKAVLITSNKTLQKLSSLTLCIIMDIIGCANYFIPFLGELSDVAWAPISAFIFNLMFGGKLGKIGAILNFIEEIVPFTDIIPSFTIAYFIRKHDREA